MEYIKIGKIVNTFGLNGELKINSFTDFNEQRFKKGNTIYILFQNEYIAMEVLKYRVHKNMLLVSFNNYLDINLVEKYKGCEIFFDKTAIEPLKKGEYYFFQLENLEVYSEENEYLGKVIKVEESVASNLLRIKKKDETEVLVPYISNFIKEVDLKNQKIIIHTIAGLI